MKNKAIIIISIILLILITTTVSASETNTTDTIAINDSNRDDAVNIESTDNVNVNTAIDSDEVSVNDATNEATVDTNTSKLNDSSIESEELSNNEDVIQSRDVLGTTNPEILTNSNNDTIILGMTPETILTDDGDYSEINVTISQSTSCYVIINFKLISIEQDPYSYSNKLYTYTWQIVGGILVNKFRKLQINSYSFYLEMLYEGNLEVGYSGSITLDFNKYITDKISIKVQYNNIQTLSQSVFLPRKLPETATTVSVTNPSVTYNSGEFSVSGTVTADSGTVNGGTVTVTIGSTSKTATVSNGAWTATGFSSTDYGITSTQAVSASYSGVSGSYKSSTGSGTLTVSKNTPTISFNTFPTNVIYNGNTYTISGKMSVNGNNINANSATVTLTVASNTYTASVNSDGTWTKSGISSTDITPASGTIKAKYNGNDYYQASSQISGTLSVAKNTPTITVNDITSVTYNGDSYSIGGTAKAGQSNNNLNTGTITLTTNTGETLTGTSTTWNNGVWTVNGISSTLLNPGSYTVTAKYTNTNYNEATSQSKDLTINKMTSTVYLNSQPSFIYNINEGQTISGTVTGGIIGNYGGHVNITVGDVKVAGNIEVDSNGLWTYTHTNTSQFKPDTYQIKVDYSGNDYQKPSYGTGTYTVNFGQIDLQVIPKGDINIGDNETIKVTLKDYNTYEVLEGYTVVLSGTPIGEISQITDSNGETVFNIPNLIRGHYSDWKVRFDKNDYYNGRTSATIDFYVKSPVYVVIDGVNPWVSTYPESILVNGHADAGEDTPHGNVTLILGDKTLNVTLDTSGAFIANFEGVVPGNYSNITCEYVPDVDESTLGGVREDVVLENNIIINKYLPVISISDVVTTFNLYPGNVTVTGMINGVNNRIPTGKIYAIIGGISYGMTNIDDSGHFTIYASNLPRGSYNINVYYEGDDYYLNNTTTSQLITISPNNVSFNITAINGTYNVDGVSSVVNVKVTGLNGGLDIAKGTIRIVLKEDNNRYWEALLDDNGEATIHITGLYAGDHIETIQYIPSTDEMSYADTSGDVAFSIYKADPVLIIKAPSVGAGRDAIINITLNQNVTGNVTLNIPGKSPIVLNISNGANRSFAIRLEPGAYDITAVYGGDVNFNSSNAETKLFIERPESYLNYTASDITYGESENIRFEVYLDGEFNTLADNATGTIRVYGLDKNYKISVVNGLAFLSVPNLTKGDYAIVAIYSGNEELGGSDKDDKFTVNGLATPLIINLNNNSVTAGDDIIVTVTVNNTINDAIQLFVDNKLYYTNATVNGVTQFVLRNLTYGSHNITAVFNGNDGFESANNNTTVSVNRIEVNPGIIIDHNRDIVFNITVPTQTTGYIRITGNGTDESILIADNMATLTLNKVTRGDYRFNIVYTGNWKYLPFDIEKTFTVTNVDDYVLNITSTEAVFNKTVNITVTAFSDLEGKTINLTVDGSTKATTTVTNGVAEFNNVYLVSNTNGEFEVVASYDGDTIYEAKSFTIHVPVIPTGDYTLGLKALSIVNVGDNVCINISAPELITVVNLTINGKTYIVNRNNFTYHIDDIDEGTYNIAVSYAGDKAYTSKNNSTVFNVVKKDSIVLVDVDDTVYGRDAVINISVTDGVSGYVLVTIDNKTSKYDLNGNKTQIITKEYTRGLHNISVVYVGDRKYNPSNNLTNFTVSRVFDYNMFVYENGTLIYNNTVLNKFVDHTLVVDVALPEDATGNLTFNLYENNIKISTWTTILPKNLINYELRKLTNYTMEILYGGDSNYENKSFKFDINVCKFLIDAEATFTDNPYYVLSDSIINITSNLNDRHVRVYIDGNYYTLTDVIADNKTVVNLAKLSHGNHIISLMYDGDDYYTSLFATHNITVFKLDSSVNVTATSVRTGNPVIIDVNASGSGSANIVIFNSTTVLGAYNITINNGVGSFIVPVDFVEGSYNVNVTYFGDEIYYGNINVTVFTVSDRVVSSLDIVKPVFVVNTPSVVNVTCNFPSGIVEVYVDGIKQDSIIITNNNGTISLEGLSAGNHKILLSFAGDYDYTEITKSFDISTIKNNSTVNVTATSIRTGNPVIIDVNASGSGSANIVIFNSTTVVGAYNITINNGVGSFIVPVDFVEGSYDVNVTYFGDEIYYGNTNKTSFTVVDRMIAEISFTEPALYIVNKTSNIMVTANFPVGTLNVWLDGKKINSILVDNYNALLVLDYLSAGNHNILVTYDGDYDYTNTTNNLTINVVKYDSLLTVDINAPLYVDDMVDITIHVNETASGYVSVNVNNKDYYVKIKDSIAKLNLTGLAYDTYTVSVNYLGDDYYNSKNTTKDFTINRYTSNINIVDIAVGSDLQINITSIDGFNPVEVTGTLNITIGTTTLNDLSIVDGKIIIPVSSFLGLYDNYRVIASYSGNYNFLPSDITTNININKLPAPTINPEYNVTIDDDLNITFNGDSRFVIDGNVTVKINDGEGFVLPVKNGVVTVPGDKLPQSESFNNIKITYVNGTYYQVMDAECVLHCDKISDYIFTISDDTVRFGENATLFIRLPDDVTDTLIIKINGADKTVAINNGYGKLENINGLHAGVNTVTATFSSGKYETSTASSTIQVDPNDISLEIIVPSEQLYVDQTAIITVRANVALNNNVTVYVNGKAQSLKLNNGEGSFTINPLVYGKYVFTAIFDGDENYTYTTASEKSFSVDKNNILLNITTANVIVGYPVNIKVNINDDATGLVIVKINNVEYSLNITNKEYTLSIPDLGNGTYSIVANYYGDDKYYGFENNTGVEVLKLTLAISANNTILIGEDLIIIIKNTTSIVDNATGKLELTIDGWGTVEGDVINGVVIIKASDLPKENNAYSARVNYSGDNNYYSLIQAIQFTVNKVPGVLITVPGNVTIDDELVITVGDNTADGKLNIIIGNGDMFTVDVVNGVAVIPVSQLPQVSDNYNIKLNYYNGSYWDDKEITTVFHVDKIIVYDFIISNDTIKFDENATLIITLPGDVNTVLTIKINDADKTVIITKGNGVLENISGLHAGINTVTATFTSGKYEISTASSTIQVDPNDITLEIIVPSE